MCKATADISLACTTTTLIACTVVLVEWKCRPDGAAGGNVWVGHQKTKYPYPLGNTNVHRNFTVICLAAVKPSCTVTKCLTNCPSASGVKTG